MQLFSAKFACVGVNEVRAASALETFDRQYGSLKRAIAIENGHFRA